MVTNLVFQIPYALRSLSPFFRLKKFDLPGSFASWTMPPKWSLNFILPVLNDSISNGIPMDVFSKRSFQKIMGNLRVPHRPLKCSPPQEGTYGLIKGAYFPWGVACGGRTLRFLWQEDLWCPANSWSANLPKLPGNMIIYPKCLFL